MKENNAVKIQDMQDEDLMTRDIVRQQDLMDVLLMDYTMDIKRWRQGLNRQLTMIKIGRVTFYLRSELAQIMNTNILPIPGNCDGTERLSDYVVMGEAKIITGLSHESICKMAREGQLETLELGQMARMYKRSEL